MDEVLIATNTQKVLDFLVRNSGKQFLAKEIQKATRASKGGINTSLRGLVTKKYIGREQRGKFILYSVDHNNPVIKQLKVLKTIVALQPTINKLKKHSKRIVLFGSCARGENTAQSDIDLFILADNPGIIKEKTEESSHGRKIQLIARTPTQFIKMEKEENIFFEEVERGIILWEHEDESRI